MSVNSAASNKMAPHLVNRWASKDGQYNYEKIIHEGTFGTTLQARKGKFGPRLTILLFNLPWAGSIRSSKFKQHVGRRHSNIVKVIECFDCNDPPLSTMLMTQFATLPPPTAVAIVAELSISGTLRIYLTKYCVNEDTRLRWYRDLARGLQYLHLNNILHWDLQPDNIWIHDDQLKIANIGFVQIARESNNKFNLNHGDFLKTYMESSVPFVSPESFTGLYNYYSEIFSLALVCLVIAESPDSGYHKAKWSDSSDYLGSLLHSNIPPRSIKSIHLLDPPISSAQPQEINLFNEMLTFNCFKRPDINMVLDSLQTMKRGGENLLSTAYKWMCSC